VGVAEFVIPVRKCAGRFGPDEIAISWVTETQFTPCIANQRWMVIASLPFRVGLVLPPGATRSPGAPRI
jgi:hypothetical protein